LEQVAERLFLLDQSLQDQDQLDPVDLVVRWDQLDPVDLLDPADPADPADLPDLADLPE